MPDEIVFTTDSPEFRTSISSLFIDPSIETDLIKPVERFNLRRFTLDGDGEKITMVPVSDVLRLLDREYELTENAGVGRLAQVIRQATGLA